MAARTSTQAGAFSAGATWVGGVAPVDGDTATVLHAVTATAAVPTLASLTVGDGGNLIGGDTSTEYFAALLVASVPISFTGTGKMTGITTQAAVESTAGGTTTLSNVVLNTGPDGGGDLTIDGGTVLTFIGTFDRDGGNIEVDGNSTLIGGPLSIVRCNEMDVYGPTLTGTFHFYVNPGISDASGATRDAAWGNSASVFNIYAAIDLSGFAAGQVYKGTWNLFASMNFGTYKTASSFTANLLSAPAQARGVTAAGTMIVNYKGPAGVSSMHLGI